MLGPPHHHEERTWEGVSTTVRVSLAPMLLSVLFAAFSVDLWLHGPVQGPMRHLGIVLAVAAAAVNEFEAFLLAECCWLALFAIQASLLKPEAPELPQELEKEAEVGPPVLDPRGVKMLEDARAVLLKNLDETSNADGKPWKLHAENREYGIKVFSSEYAGQSFKRWKVRVQVKQCTIETMLDQVFNFKNRCGKAGWDVAIKEGQVAVEFRGGEYSLSRACTHPAGGGAISSREFMDLRWRQRGGDGVPKDGVLLTMVSPDPKKDTFLPLPKPNKSLVRAMNFPGSGVRLTPLDGGDILYESSSAVNIGGWLPNSVVNSATAGAMMESHVAMVDHLRKFSK